MRRIGKASTIVVTIFLAITTIFAIYLFSFDVKDFKELLESAKEGVENANHIAEGAAALFIAWFGALAIVFVIILIIIVIVPSTIMIIFTSLNIKSDIKWIKVINIIYTIVLGLYIVLSLVKTVMLIVY